jgi:hypothetical protein
MGWGRYPKASATHADGASVSLSDNKPDFVVQLVRQVNYGPLESTRYFAKLDQQGEPFTEVTEKELIDANFKKLNSYVLICRIHFSRRC